MLTDVIDSANSHVNMAFKFNRLALAYFVVPNCYYKDLYFIYLSHNVWFYYTSPWLHHWSFY